MTKEQAIKKLTETRILSTDLLEPLGISFEKFLQFAQLKPNQQQIAVRHLIIKLHNENNKDPNSIVVWKNE